jgi:hypothetical protein
MQTESSWSHAYTNVYDTEVVPGEQRGGGGRFNSKNEKENTSCWTPPNRGDLKRVRERTKLVVVGGTFDEETAVQECLSDLAGLVCIDGDVVDDVEVASSQFCGERHAKTHLAHLLGEIVCERTRFGRKRTTTTHPVRRTTITSSCTAGPLLWSHLLGATTHFSPRFTTRGTLLNHKRKR